MHFAALLHWARTTVVITETVTAEWNWKSDDHQRNWRKPSKVLNGLHFRQGNNCYLSHSLSLAGVCKRRWDAATRDLRWVYPCRSTGMTFLFNHVWVMCKLNGIVWPRRLRQCVWTTMGVTQYHKLDVPVTLDDLMDEKQNSSYWNCMPMCHRPWKPSNMLGDSGIETVFSFYSITPEYIFAAGQSTFN